jgi:hypothetical protein
MLSLPGGSFLSWGKSGLRIKGKKMMLLYMDRWAVKYLLLLSVLLGCPCLFLLQACFGCYGCALGVLLSLVVLVLIGLF